MDSPFHGGFNDTPLVGLEFFRRFIRGLECVGFVDLILDVVIDVVVLLVASIALLFRRFFVGGEWEVSLAWDDG